MALVNSKCPRCNNKISLDSEQRVCFCLYCGGRIVVAEAIRRLLKEHGSLTPEAPPPPPDEMLREAGGLLGNRDFAGARKLFERVLMSDEKNSEAAWGQIKCLTENLTPRVISTLEDFVHGAASDLLARSGIPPEWSTDYYNAFWECCRMTVTVVDPKIYLETEIFKWNPVSNSFVYPISRQFDVNTIVDKTLAPLWDLLSGALPESRRNEFSRICDGVRGGIAAYYRTGFSNLDEIADGNLTKLMGAWSLRLTTGEVKTDVLRFSLNAVNMPYCEGYRLSLNSYDYYRGISMSGLSKIVAAERRHFPSMLGTGGDFERHESPVLAFDVIAVYDYLFVTPKALYAKADITKIAGIEKALAFAEKCRAMPCFQRNGIKASAQIRPITENHDTFEPSRNVSSCYIATAVYGDVDAPEVRVLRAFRDGPMQRSRAGRSLSALYYRFSPPLAARLTGARRTNRAVRCFLDVIVRIVKNRR